jgi:hypothetical protein
VQDEVDAQQQETDVPRAARHTIPSLKEPP